jgi:3-oxoacyl-[acyl-carrier protein] reductase
MDLNLGSKLALVTGGSRGIGRAIAQRLVAEGSHVAICGRTPETLERAVAELRAQPAASSGAAGSATPGQEPARVHGVVADVTTPGEVERFVEESAAVLGGVDLLVANVGGSSGGGLLDSTPEDWQRTFDLNLFHAVRAIRAVVPHMTERGGGSAVTISSISGWKPAPKAQYGAAKAGEIFLAGALAWELGPQRIRVNTLSPGSTLFPGGGWERFREQNPEQFAQFEQREFPWGRLGTAQEIADVVVFLLSDCASWVNGANIPVDGAQGRPNAF